MSDWTAGSVRSAAAVHARIFDEELVILDLAKGEYFSLDDVGARLWAGLEAGRNVQEIAKEIAAEYDVTPERALSDLVTLGDELLAKGLLVRGEGHEGG